MTWGSLVALSVFLVCLVLGSLRTVIVLLGTYLRTHTRDSRDLLYAAFKRDRDIGRDETVVDVSNGWSEVGTSSRKRNVNKWSGIVGFFHPFW